MNMNKVKIIQNALSNNGVLPCVSGELHIATGTCCNSSWIASWLAKRNQENCQCGFECKVKVKYKGWNYWLTKKELFKLVACE